MEQRRPPTAFVSYSWDSKEHEEWVHCLVNRLRSDDSGIDASFDKFELYDKTVNLNQMMIKEMRDNDFVIIVLTENYGKRADAFQGGVGFEAELLLADLRRNKDRLIFIMRHKGNFEEAFPSYLRDYYAIDFSQDSQFEQKFEELVHRVYRYNKYEKAPLGTMPSFLYSDLTTTPLQQASISPSFPKLNLPRTFTDLDKEGFIRTSYLELKKLFTALFDQVKNETAGFTYHLDEESSKKCIYKLYVHGQHKTSLKMLIGGFSFSSPAITFSFGNHSLMSDSSMNEMLSVEEKDNELKLGMLMSFRKKGVHHPEAIVERIWEDHLMPYLKP
ncbi:toll/interleukin-1 receptor domain-containing protein [Paenibacillus humicus]|uniref:toll/interleukin-1 receptor domain-containing protein n=1 Tax=Paenibacillus humicus TaxID=412861 RepID=UPI003F16FBDD